MFIRPVPAGIPIMTLKTAHATIKGFEVMQIVQQGDHSATIDGGYGSSPPDDRTLWGVFILRAWAFFRIMSRRGLLHCLPSADNIFGLNKRPIRQPALVDRMKCSS